MIHNPAHMQRHELLQKAIGGADIEELNFDLREKYFDKKFGI